MDIEEKIQLICRPPTEEVLTVEELRQLLEKNEHPGHYIGFEISGMLHLGNFVVSGFKINDFIKAGLNCQVFFADWHSFITTSLRGTGIRFWLQPNITRKHSNFSVPASRLWWALSYIIIMMRTGEICSGFQST